MSALRAYKIFTAAGITGLLLFVSGSVFSQMRWNDGWRGPGMMYGYYGGSWLWMLLHAAVWIIAIAGIIFLARWILGSFRPAHHAHGGPAIEILKRRYAKGEINKEEFEQKKKDIE